MAFYVSPGFDVEVPVEGAIGCTQLSHLEQLKKYASPTRI